MRISNLKCVFSWHLVLKPFAIISDYITVIAPAPMTKKSSSLRNVDLAESDFVTVALWVVC